MLEKAIKSSQFAFKATPSLLKRIRSKKNDPIALQIYPSSLENRSVAGFKKNPLKENQFQPIPGLLHKYHGRALILISNECAVHCRYCFRRFFDFEKNKLTDKRWQQILRYLKSHKNIYEIILSGGDPLMLPSTKIRNYINALAKIPHLKYLRIHTRVPIADPKRLSNTLIKTLTSTRLKPIIIVQCNHAQEINSAVAKILKKIQAHNIPTFNQSVLLKNINDTISALSDLSFALFKNNVVPYYLHFLDPVQGAAHFAVSPTKAKKLIQQLRESLPGYLVPRLVIEKPGKKHKMPL